MGSRPRLIPAFHAAALRRTGVATLSLLMFVGCSPTLQAPLKGPDGAGPDSGDYRLDHGYTLLMDLLADEARVVDILGLKSASPSTEEILRAISSAASEASVDLAAMRSKAPPILVGTTGLPILEVDARNRLKNQETVGLLLSGGTSFELRILLTQEKASGYIAALAEGLASADPNPARRDRLTRLSRRFLGLNAELRQRLAVKSD
jgi:hypothetical protein